MHGIARATLFLAGWLPVVHASLPPESRRGAVSMSYPAPRSYFEARVDPRDPPVLAIRKHLAEVEAYLRALPPPGLDSARMAARTARLDDLRAYWMRGEFPRNVDFPGRLVPYFIDDRDVACAVGHLIRVSGARAFAEEVARTDNHVYLPELRDPRLGEWARANGFTVEELARIQPAYGYFPQDILKIAIDSRNRPWVVAGVGLMFNASYYNLGADDRWAASSSGVFNGSASFCTVGDEALAIFSDPAGPMRISHRGVQSAHPELNGMGTGPCVGTRNGTNFLVGGMRGMSWYGFGEDGVPALRDSMRAGVENFPAGPVTHVAWPGPVMWAGTAQHGLAYRGAARDWTVLDYPSLGGAYLGGLKAGSSANVWAGLLTQSPVFWMERPIFSEVGLVSLVGEGAPKRFHRGNSPLPSDTVYLAAPGPGRSIWLTCDRKQLLRFTPPDTLVAMPFTLPDYAHSLEVDTLGRPYLGTYAPGMTSSYASGLYRVEGERLVPLGYPLRQPLAVVPERRKSPGPGIGFLSGPFGSRDGGLSRLDAMGRRADRVSAAGIYLSEGIGSPSR